MAIKTDKKSPALLPVDKGPGTVDKQEVDTLRGNCFSNGRTESQNCLKGVQEILCFSEFTATHPCRRATNLARDMMSVHMLLLAGHFLYNQQQQPSADINNK